MYFGMFGSIFLLMQFFQTAQGYSPLKAGRLLLPWTAMELFVAPVAGALSDRIGGRPLMAAGLALQAAGSLDRGGLDAPSARGARRAVRPLRDRDGDVLRPGGEHRPLRRTTGRGGEGLGCEQRDPRGRWGARRRRARLDLRRLGGYESADTFTDGLVPAIWAGAAVVAVGAALALLIPRRRHLEEATAAEPDQLVPQAEAA